MPIGRSLQRMLGNQHTLFLLLVLLIHCTDKKTDIIKQLVKLKAEAERVAAEKKAEEDKAAILAAVEASGKSVEEILELLK